MSIQEYILSRDFHVHTNLSVCARPEMTPANIIARAQQRGYRQLGISDHLGTYLRPANLKKLGVRLRRVQTDIEVYLGCELCVTKAGAPCLPGPEIGFLDYVMVGVDHVDSNIGTPQDNPGKWLREWVRRLETLIQSKGRIDIIAHPLRTLRGYHRGRPLMTHLPARRWEELLGALADRGTAVELDDTVENYDTCYDEIRAFAHIARDKGVKFSMNSDAHALDRLGFQINWVPLAKELGLTKRDFWSPANGDGQR